MSSKTGVQAVVLAAGKSTRTQPLTSTRPKPLLPLLGSTIIEHNLEQLLGLVDEVLIVVGYREEMLREHLGDRYRSLPLRYIRQTEQKGTGHALQAVKSALKDRFLVLNGDDLYHHADLAACLRHELSLLGAHHDDTSRFGVLEVEHGEVIDIIEKPAAGCPGLVNTGVHVLDRRIFDHELALSVRGEFELVDYIRLAEGVKLVEAQQPWLPISYPWNLIEANVWKLDQCQPKLEGELSDGVHINGPVMVGQGSRILSGSVIEGPAYIGKNCTIGPNAYLRPYSVILDNCHVGHGAEIVDSVLFPHVTCKHRAYIGHSVIGEGVNVGAGLITADYRHDGGEVHTLIKGQRVNSQRTKLGAFIGDHVRLGIRTAVYPGRKIWPELTTLPGEIVTNDKTEA